MNYNNISEKIFLCKSNVFFHNQNCSVMLIILSQPQFSHKNCICFCLVQKYNPVLSSFVTELGQRDDTQHGEMLVFEVADYFAYTSETGLSSTCESHADQPSPMKSIKT